MPRLDGACFETLGYPEDLANTPPHQTAELRLPEALVAALLCSRIECAEQLDRGLALLLAQARNASGRALLLDVDDVARKMTSVEQLLRSAELDGPLGRLKQLERHTCGPDFVVAPRDGRSQPFAC